MMEYKRLKRELVAKGSIIDYYIDTMQIPNGNTEQWDFIKHKGAAAMVAIDQDGKLLMVRQYRNALERNTLEIPAGGLNPGEDMKTAATRELEEETGYRSEHIEHLLDINTTVAFCNEKIGIYYATDLIKSKQHLDENEFLRVERHSISELEKMIYAGEITDSKTIVAVLAIKDKFGTKGIV